MELLGCQAVWAWGRLADGADWFHPSCPGHTHLPLWMTVPCLTAVCLWVRLSISVSFGYQLNDREATGWCPVENLTRTLCKCMQE